MYLTSSVIFCPLHPSNDFSDRKTLTRRRRSCFRTRGILLQSGISSINLSHSAGNGFESAAFLLDAFIQLRTKRKTRGIRSSARNRSILSRVCRVSPRFSQRIRPHLCSAATPPGQSPSAHQSSPHAAAPDLRAEARRRHGARRCRPARCRAAS